VTSILRTADYFGRFCSPVFDQHASPRIKQRPAHPASAGLGASELDIAERMIEQARYNPLAGSAWKEEARAPGTPLRYRRQVLCYITSLGSISCKNSTPPLGTVTKRCIG